MAYTSDHGPPLFDATQDWDPASGTAPPTLNDTNTEPPAFPRIVIDKCTGWRSLPDREDRRAPRTVGVGEVKYPARETGKTLVYECRVEALAREDLTLTQNALLQGFADTDEGVMTVTPWAVPGGVVWTFSAAVTALEFDPSWTLSGESGSVTYEWAFVLTLRMSDPLFYTGGTGYR
jgi:hypothetical protein